MIAIDTKMPKNCMECDIRDIRDMFFDDCPCDFTLDHRPPNCPLLEVSKLRCDRIVVTDIEPREITEKVLSDRLAEFICSHRELIQFKNDVDIPGYDLLFEKIVAELNVVLPKGAKLNEQD